jgi:acetyl-CoA C-acetyltransferase
VSITGIGTAHPDAEGGPQSLESLIFASAGGALADGGLERRELDGVVLSASDQVDGRAIASMLSSGPAGAYLNDEINVASSPGHAVALACMQLLAGTHSRLLVSSWGMASETASGSTQAAERLSAEPFFERDGGITALAATAMQAQAFRAASADPDAATQAAAAVAAKNHARPDVTAADVAASPYVAYPLRDLERPPEVDAAFSLLLERDDREVDGGVAIDGVGWCSETARVVDRDLVGAPHLVRAARDAYDRAGTSPAAVDLWQLHDYSPDAELIAYGALGLCAPPEAVALALSGETGAQGAQPVNPGGGSVVGEAPFGGPLGKLVAAARQLRGSAGTAQVPGVERAVAHIASGFAGQFQSVFVLGRRA